MNSTDRSLALAAALAALALSHAAGAATRAIEDVRFVKQNGVARAEIVFVCPVRYLSHTPDSGLDVQVRVALEPECLAELGAGVRSELVDPPAGNLAGVKQIVFDTTVEVLEARVARVAINVGRIARFSVSQGAMRNVLRVEIDTTQATEADAPPSLGPAAPRAPAASPPAESRPPTPAPRGSRLADAAPALDASPPPEPSDRRPLRLVQPAAARTERFAIQLAAGENASAAADELSMGAGEVLYANEQRAGTREWQELRLGFFDTETAARARLATLSERFPAAVIAVASIAEQDAAAVERRLAGAAPAAASAAATSARASDGDVPRGSGAAETDAGGRVPPGETASAHGLPALAPERMQALAAEANDALLAQNYARSIQIYTRLLEEPDYADRREARERLGVARERNGQIAQARLEYETYLQEFPDGPDSERVRQRLAGVVPAAAARERVEAVASADSRWDYRGGVAQYYRRDVYQPLDTLPESTQEALLSNADLLVRRRGERFDLTTRVDAMYRYNLQDEAKQAWSFEPADQLYLTNGYVEIVDQQRDWSARLGRQSLHSSGVLGRFDGAHAEYQLKPDLGLNLTLGRPVDYPRHSVDTHRQFAAFSADFGQLVKRWDMSFFGMLQQVDGIYDREAVGAEARFRSAEWSVVSAVDFDLSYGVLNSALVSANWRPSEKLTVNGRLNVGTAPFLMTRNALIGQAATSIEELLGTYTEGQVRHIAHDRTAEERDATLGLSWPVFDRYELNVDLAYSEYGATIASAGVEALPESGPQTFFMATLVGSSVLKSGDTTIFSLRHSDTRTSTSDTFVFDVRLPAGRVVRVNPRIALTERESTADGSDQWIVAPQLRLTLRSANHHRFDLELGWQVSDKDLPAPDPLLGGQTTEQSSAYFVNAGYWWEF